MRNVALVLAVATATAYAQTSDVKERLRRAVVHVQTVDRELLRAEELRRQEAPIVQLRACRIQQPWVCVLSGVAISEAEILTNAVHPRADLRITVTWFDGQQAEAELVGTDPLSNLALLRVPAPVPAHLALHEDAVRLHESVRLVGFEAEPREPVTVEGSVNREQAPVTIRDLYGVTRGGAIALGSAFAVAATEGHPHLGSACVDEEGRLVGLVVAALPTHFVAHPDEPGRWTRVEMRFAVPAARLARVVRDLRAHGRVIRAHFGVQFQAAEEALRAQFDLPGSAAGVTALQDGGPAARAGLRLHDVILSLDGTSYRDAHELGEAMSEKPIGEPVSFAVLREGKPLTLAATPVER